MYFLSRFFLRVFRTPPHHSSLPCPFRAVLFIPFAFQRIRWILDPTPGLTEMGTSGCSKIHLLSAILDPRTNSMLRVSNHIQQIAYIFLKEELKKVADEKVGEVFPERDGLFMDDE